MGVEFCGLNSSEFNPFFTERNVQARNQANTQSSQAADTNMSRTICRPQLSLQNSLQRGQTTRWPCDLSGPVTTSSLPMLKWVSGYVGDVLDLEYTNMCLRDVLRSAIPRDWGVTGILR